MATETSRTRSVRRITAPGDTGTYIDLKIIDDITFRETQPPYQEWVLKFQNNPDDAARTVRVVEVGDAKLKVERIDTLDTEESTGRRQESIWSFLNSENPPVHLETHETTIYASDGNGNITDTGTWIKVQRVDKIEFEDSADEVRGQESVWSLDNPDKSDDKDDYKDLTSPVKTWDNSTINPPWRIDPFQTITDCSFGGRYMLVLYGSNKIAAVKISKTGSFTAPFKKTLQDSSWSAPAEWATWFYQNTPSLFLKTAQMKVSKNFHALSCPIKIDNWVISIPSNLSTHPVFNVSETLNKYAENTAWTLEDEEQSRYVDPVINGTSTHIYNEYLDRFQIEPSGISKVSSGPTLRTFRTPSAIGVNGERYSRIQSTYFEASLNNGIVSPYSTEQETAVNNWIAELSGMGISPPVAFYYGPGNSDFTGVYSPPLRTIDGTSGTLTLSTKIQVYSKSNGLDVFSLNDATVTTYSTSTLIEVGVPYLTCDINYCGITTSGYTGSLGDMFPLTFQFPYAMSANSTGMFYKKWNRLNPDSGSNTNTYWTPYETWTTAPASDETLLAPTDQFFSGWLQVSDGTHMIHGYIKNGQKRLFMDGVEKGSALAAAIGCSLEDIATVIMGVKMSDIQKLK